MKHGVGIWRKGLALLLALAAPVPLAAQPTPSDEQVAARAEGYMQTLFARRGFGGSVLLARGDRVIFNQAYGFADVEHKVLNTPETLFRIASITKPFTAAAVLKLHEQGRLSVEDAFCDRIPACPPAWRGIRIRQLLNHSSGIPNFTAQPFFQEGQRLQGEPGAIAARVQNLPLLFEPGARTEYSNTNYLLLGLVVEHTARKKLEPFLKEQFFDRLGMASTMLDRPETIVPGRARGYVWSRASGILNAPYVEMPLHKANGGLLSTAQDLFRWVRGLRAPGVLGQASIDAMTTASPGGYGFGWGVGTVGGRPFYGHAGDISGFSSQLVHVPSEDATIVVLMNNQAADAPRMAADLAAILFDRDRR